MFESEYKELGRHFAASDLHIYNLPVHVLIISPTHKRTEGRAPMWGSEFTSKDAAL
jgi:hypothetical protein